MADNFNMKQFLAENKLGAYSKLKEAEEKEEGYMGTQYDSSEDMAVDMMKKGITEATPLKLKGYYQVLDAGTNEWNDDFQYMGKIAGGSSAGEVGEHMFVAPDAPGSFAFVSISDADLDTMVKPSMSEGKEKEEEQFGGINERLEPHVYERMANLSNLKAQQAMIKAAEILMRDLTEEGFEVPEIREFFNQLIANDI